MFRCCRLAANTIAVSPLQSAILTSVWASKSNLTISSNPNPAALCSAVCSFSSWASTLQPLDRSRRTSCSSPLRAAQWSAICPTKFGRFPQAPAESSASTISVDPSPVAKCSKPRPDEDSYASAFPSLPPFGPTAAAKYLGQRRSAMLRYISMLSRSARQSDCLKTLVSDA